jgi:RNA polymerase sigma factor (sigma-70 family)
MSIFENNRDLLDRFRRGDRAALAEVYERYVDDVAILARRGFTMESQGHVYVAGADPDGERELVQETFVKAFGEKARDSFDGLRPYRPFLLRITKNLMIDRFRARRKDRMREDGDGVGDIDAILEANGAFAEAPDHERDLHWQKLSAATKTFLSQLDRQTQEVVRLRFEEDLSQDACAKKLGCSRRRVRTLEERVQKQLRRHLKESGMLDG